MDGDEVGIYLNSLKQLVLADLPSIRRWQISIIKEISTGEYKNKLLK